MRSAAQDLPYNTNETQNGCRFEAQAAIFFCIGIVWAIPHKDCAVDAQSDFL
jgi:hypothetical protein